MPCHFTRHPSPFQDALQIKFTFRSPNQKIITTTVSRLVHLLPTVWWDAAIKAKGTRLTNFEVWLKLPDVNEYMPPRLGIRKSHDVPTAQLTEARTVQSPCSRSITLLSLVLKLVRLLEWAWGMKAWSFLHSCRVMDWGSKLLQLETCNNLNVASATDRRSCSHDCYSPSFWHTLMLCFCLPSAWAQCASITGN